VCVCVCVCVCGGGGGGGGGNCRDKSTKRADNACSTDHDSAIDGPTGNHARARGETTHDGSVRNRVAAATAVPDGAQQHNLFNPAGVLLIHGHVLKNRSWFCGSWHLDGKTVVLEDSLYARGQNVSCT
jgi:hypothetical protein